MITYLKLLGMAFFWGGTFVAGRSLAQDVGPFSAAFFRFVIASLFLVILLYKAEGKIPIPQKHPRNPTAKRKSPVREQQGIELKMIYRSYESHLGAILDLLA